MKYHILHDFGTSTSFNGKSSTHLKDLHKLKLLTNFDVSLTSFHRGSKFLAASGYEIRLTSKFVSNFKL